MTIEQIKVELNQIGDRLVPVAGLLMQVACSNGQCARYPEEHNERCECRVCKAFLTVQDIQNKIELVVKALS